MEAKHVRFWIRCWWGWSRRRRLIYGGRVKDGPDSDSGVMGDGVRDIVKRRKRPAAERHMLRLSARDSQGRSDNEDGESDPPGAGGGKGRAAVKP